MRSGRYRFWESDAWRAWRHERTAWRDYRSRFAVLQGRVRDAHLAMRSASEDERRAEQSLAWVSELSRRELPIRTTKSEIGLGTVAEVALLEVRRREGEDVWTVVDNGVVHFTDRRIVFAGDRDISFEYDDITVDSVTGHGWHLGVRSRKRSHVLSGPVEQLMVLRNAVVDGVGGVDPRRRWQEVRAGARARHETARELRDSAQTDLSNLARPPRPLSPAWVPGMALLVVALAVTGEGESPRPTVLAAQVTTTTAATVAAPDASDLPSDATVGDPTVAHVLHVTGANTLELEMSDGTRLLVTLAGIEVDGTTAAEARTVLHDLIRSSSLELEPEPAAGENAYYLYADGELVNARLAEAGLVVADADGLSLADLFARAEEVAQQAAVGIWAPTTTTTASTTSPSSTTTTSGTTTTISTTTTTPACHPSYEGACVPVGVEDVDCAGGSGNGPYYVGRVTVVGPDEYGLDGDNDGIGCE